MFIDESLWLIKNCQRVGRGVVRTRVHFYVCVYESATWIALKLKVFVQANWACLSYHWGWLVIRLFLFNFHSSPVYIFMIFPSFFFLAAFFTSFNFIFFILLIWLYIFLFLPVSIFYCFKVNKELFISKFLVLMFYRNVKLAL